MPKEGKYTLETLLPLNVSYDYDHMLTQGDVDMVNSIVEVIESTRSERIPKVGDRIAYVRDDGSYHGRALIEREIDGYFRICTAPCIPFVWIKENDISLDVSGGPFCHADIKGLRFTGWIEADFKKWGHCGPTVNGTVSFKARVPLWSYIESSHK